MVKKIPQTSNLVKLLHPSFKYFRVPLRYIMFFVNVLIRKALTPLIFLFGLFPFTCTGNHIVTLSEL
jgi:hypothetical protein